MPRQAARENRPTTCFTVRTFLSMARHLTVSTMTLARRVDESFGKLSDGQAEAPAVPYREPCELDGAGVRHCGTVVAPATARGGRAARRGNGSGRSADHSSDRVGFAPPRSVGATRWRGEAGFRGVGYSLSAPALTSAGSMPTLQLR